jgi:ATP-binding cassette subfamily B protein
VVELTSTLKKRVHDGFRVDRAIRLVWAAAPRWSALNLLLLISQALVPLVTLYLFKLVVDQLTQAGASTGEQATFAGLMILLGFLVAVALLANLCSALLAYASVLQTHLVSDRVHSLVQAKSIDLDLEHYESPIYQDILHRTQREAPARPLRIVEGLTQVGRNGVTLAGAFVVLLAFHWAIVFAVFLAATPILFYRFRYAHVLYEWHREKTMNERLSAYFNQVLTTADAAKEVRVFGFGAALMDRFALLRQGLRSGVQQISAQHSRRQFVTESIATIAAYGCLAWVAHAAWTGTIGLGDLVLYFGAFQVALGATRPLLSGLGELYENNLYLSALYEFLTVPKRVRESTHPKPLPPRWHTGLCVKGVSFRYPDTERTVLDDIRLAIEPGETVALVGRNGSGKTTLVKLLCRLYDPTSGGITIDGVDIREFKTADLRRQIGIIYQDFGRYHVSARDNIWLGRPELDQDDGAIMAAAQQAGIHEDLLELHRGYDTLMSRGLTDGAELSIGQWQKLALARAFIRDPQLVILDEPTSSLDAAAEFEFFENFRVMAKGRSALVISHRFSTVSLADRIYVLDHGRIVEEGAHKRLLALNGVYAHLFRKQASYYQPRGASAGGINSANSAVIS